MTDSSLMPHARLFAVKLNAPHPLNLGRVTGRLEDVLSGRLYEFDSGAALLAFLVREQSQAYSIEPAATAGGSGIRHKASTPSRATHEATHAQAHQPHR
jgi:hypothetical protein